MLAPRAEIGNAFASQSAHVDVAAAPHGAKLIVSSTEAVTDPVVGFVISVGCDVGLSREYILLVAPPSAAPVTPAVAPHATVAARSSDGVLRVDDGLTLEALARHEYPLQPKAREKFMRMMMQVTPALTSSKSQIEAGSELRLPPGLPQQRVGPYRGKRTVAPKAAGASSVATALPTSRKGAARIRKMGGRDRLVLGAVHESNESKLLAEAERLTNMLLEQNKAQDELVAKVAKLEADYASFHKEILTMQANLGRIEAERLADKRAAEDSRPTQMLELLVAVLLGGAAGGAGLHVFQQRRTRPLGAS